MVAVGRIDDLQRRKLTAVTIGELELVVVSTQQGLKVIENRCPHQQSRTLHEGSIEANGLTCPLHGRTFDLADGSCRNGSGRLTFLTTVERDGVLFSMLPQAPDYGRF